MTVVYDEYAPAVVHELTERRVTQAAPPPLVTVGDEEAALRAVPSRSVSVVCRLCHGDLDPDGYCALDGEVTLR